jgi:hypothetical protein
MCGTNSLKKLQVCEDEVLAGSVLIIKLLLALKGDDKVKCFTFYDNFIDVNDSDKNFMMSSVTRALPHV